MPCSTPTYVEDCGWIKLHRKLLKSPIINQPDYLAVWIYLLLMANHEERSIFINGQNMLIKPGELITSRLKMAAASGVQEKKIDRILNYFKSEQQIGQVNLHTCRLISITNWETYQERGQQSEQRVGSRWAADGQPMGTNKNVRMKECKNERSKDSCAEPSASTPEASPILVFPCTGKEKEWPLTQVKIDEYQDSYPGVAVITEAKKALQWCRDNPTHRKTSSGMSRFLNSWLSKSQNGNGHHGQRFETKIERTIRLTNEHLERIKHDEN